MSNFKENYSPSEKLLYNYAIISSWAGDLQTSYSETNKLLNKNPDNTDYQLLLGKLLVWMNKDLNKAQAYLEYVLSKNPDEYDALLSAVPSDSAYPLWLAGYATESPAAGLAYPVALE